MVRNLWQDGFKAAFGTVNKSDKKTRCGSLDYVRKLFFPTKARPVSLFNIVPSEENDCILP